MLGESHSIHHEFPEHRERIDALMKEEQAFRDRVAEHDRLDKTIRGLELRENPIADRDLEAMKAERLHLKDVILRRLNGG